MDVEARLATFEGAAGPKSRRIGSRSNKVAPKAKGQGKLAGQSLGASMDSDVCLANIPSSLI
jgi:hypothetical protein